MTSRNRYYKKNKEYLFVDGYNIINNWEKLRKIATEDLEKSRLELMEIMAEYAHISGVEVVLVYDAYMVDKNPESSEEYKGIKVVFTKEFETADHYIEREITSIGRVRSVKVATSDYVEQQIVLSRGATRISARELEVEIYNLKNSVDNRVQKIKEDSRNYLNKLDQGNIQKLRKLKNKLK